MMFSLRSAPRRFVVVAVASMALTSFAVPAQAAERGSDGPLTLYYW